MLSITGIAQQDIDPLKVIIKSKPLGYDKDSGKQIVLINITTNKIGNFTYTEKYYTINSTGHLIFSSKATHYNGKLTNNETVFQIVRPVIKTEKSYPFIKSVVTVENQTASAWIKRSKITTNNSTGNKLNNIDNNTGNRSDRQNDSGNNKKIPGFEIIMSIVIIPMIYLLIRKKI